MSRLLIAVVTAGLVALVGEVVPSMSRVGGQESGTPAPVVATAVADPCARAAAAMPAGTPAIAATPRAEVAFDRVYLDLVLSHTERLTGVAIVVAERAELEALRIVGLEMAVRLEERARRLGVWRSLWLGEQPALTHQELIAAVERLGEASPGRGGIPGGFEILGMTGLVEQACAAANDDAALLDLLIGAVDADLLLARVAVEQAEHDELRLEAAAIADRDQQWLDGLIALRARWYGDGATPAASPMAFE